MLTNIPHILIQGGNMQVLKLIQTNEIRIRRVKWGKEDRLDIRVFFIGDDGIYHPTKRGVFIPFNMIGKLIKELQHLQRTRIISE